MFSESEMPAASRLSLPRRRFAARAIRPPAAVGALRRWRERRSSTPSRPSGRREDVACGRHARYVLRTRDAEVHPSCIHGVKHFFGRSGVALRDAELLERFRPSRARDCKGFHVELQDFTQLLRDLIPR